jgi:hypothetical protein
MSLNFPTKRHELVSGKNILIKLKRFISDSVGGLLMTSKEVPIVVLPEGVRYAIAHNNSQL